VQLHKRGKGRKTTPWKHKKGKKGLNQQGHPCWREVGERLTSGASRQTLTIKLGRRLLVGQEGFAKSHVLLLCYFPISAFMISFK